jgi:hypothetical protein
MGAQRDFEKDALSHKANEAMAQPLNPQTLKLLKATYTSERYFAIPDGFEAHLEDLPNQVVEAFWIKWGVLHIRLQHGVPIPSWATSVFIVDDVPTIKIESGFDMGDLDEEPDEFDFVNALDEFDEEEILDIFGPDEEEGSVFPPPGFVEEEEEEEDDENAPTNVAETVKDVDHPAVPYEIKVDEPAEPEDDEESAESSEEFVEGVPAGCIHEDDIPEHDPYNHEIDLIAK